MLRKSAKNDMMTEYEYFIQETDRESLEGRNNGRETKESTEYKE